jgi:hypothetical protein
MVVMKGVGNTRLFIYCFQQRCYDIDKQKLRSDISSYGRLSRFSAIKDTFQPESYLGVIHQTIYCGCLTSLRIGVLLLRTNYGRCENLDYVDRICQYCSLNNVDNEYHCCVVCPFSNDIRIKFISKYTVLQRVLCHMIRSWIY